MNEETRKFYVWAKDHFLNTIPLTIIGYVLTVFLAVIFKTNSIEFVVDVGQTGIYVLCLGCCYVIGKGTHLLINAGLSRITHEERRPEA